MGRSRLLRSSGFEPRTPPSRPADVLNLNGPLIPKRIVSVSEAACPIDSVLRKVEPMLRGRVRSRYDMLVEASSPCLIGFLHLSSRLGPTNAAACGQSQNPGARRRAKDCWDGEETQTHSQIDTQAAGPRTVQVSRLKQPSFDQLTAFVRSR
jgi:hypothetical protein